MIIRFLLVTAVSFAPFFLVCALHGRRIRVSFEPIRRAAGTISESFTLNGTLSNLWYNSTVGPRRRRKVDLRKLLHQVETATIGSPELDREFESTFRSVPPNVTRSIDAAARLIETELSGWWWNCGHC